MCTTAPAVFSGNFITYNNAHPLRVHADDVGEVFSSNTISNLNTNSYLEVTAGTITRDATWPSDIRYHILGNITVQGIDGDDDITTLTIEKGAELRFNRNIRLNIGSTSGDPGALSAVGTDDEPILFTSNRETPEAGDWYGINFYDDTTNDASTILEHCVVEYAGCGRYAGYGVHINQASPIIRNSTIRYSKYDGIYVSGSESAPLISDNEISDNGRYGICAYSGSPSPIIDGNRFLSNVNYDIYYGGSITGEITGNRIENGINVYSSPPAVFSGNTIIYNNNHPLRVHADDVGKVVSSNTFSNLNTNSYLEVIGGTIRLDATWPSDIRYHILGNITVQGIDGADEITTLTIEPGAELRFSQYIQLNIGDTSGEPGALSAVGTVDEPIIFTSNQETPEAGDWYGIYLYDTDTDDVSMILEHCVVEYAGYNGYGVYINQASPIIRNSTIRYSEYSGIYITGAESAPLISGNEISDNDGYGIYITSGLPIITYNQITGNTSYGVYNATSSNTVMAENNWWGNASGLYDPSDDNGEFYNPDGTGDMVSDYVDYDPWVIDPDDMDGWYY